MWAFFREPYWCALLALTLNTAAYASEIIRGGLQSVPHAAGRGGARLRHVAACCCSAASSSRSRCGRRCPAYGSEIILMVKATSLASIITMMEVTGLAAKLISQTFRAVEVFIVRRRRSI